MKDQEKIKRKKFLTSRTTEESVRVESTSNAQPQYGRERLPTDPSSHGLTASNKPVGATTATVRMPSPSVNGPSLEKLKQEKLKANSGNSIDDPRGMDGALPKKKAKKLEPDSGEAHFRSEKSTTQQGEERQKLYKQPLVTAAAAAPHKSNLHQGGGAVPNFEQSS